MKKELLELVENFKATSMNNDKDIEERLRASIVADELLKITSTMEDEVVINVDTKKVPKFVMYEDGGNEPLCKIFDDGIWFKDTSIIKVFIENEGMLLDLYTKDELVEKLQNHYEDMWIYDSGEDLKEGVREGWSVGEIYDDYDIEDYVSSFLSIDDCFSEDDVIEYCRENIDVEDVYDDVPTMSEDKIKEYCCVNLSVGEVYDEDEILDYIKDRFNVNTLVDLSWK